MEKKIVLITGASDGIGKETAKTIAKEGHTLIIHGRNKEKTLKVYEEIKRETGNNNIDMIIADMLSLQEVKNMAEEIKKKYDHLDILINNAGAQFTDKREITVDGHEKHMAINVFAPFLLTKLLIDLLKKSQSARVVTVSSASHSMTGKVDINDLEFNSKYNMAKAYGTSKLYIIWVMRHFIEETKKKGISNITFNVVHLGSAQSSLGRESTKSLKWRLIYFLWKPLITTALKGAESSIKAAISPEFERISGKYIGPKGIEKVNEKYYSKENEKILWEYCEQITKIYI